MIQQLIDEYVKAGGRKPYAVLMGLDIYDDLPDGVFCAWTPVIHQRVIVLPLSAASALLHESAHLLSEVAEGKEADA